MAKTLRKFKPRICPNADCSVLFTPKSGESVYCKPCNGLRAKARRAQAARERYRRVEGCTCLWCGVSDSLRAFKTLDECNACAGLAQNNGRCTPCEGRPLRKNSRVPLGENYQGPLQRPMMPSCDTCGMAGAGEGFVQVTLFCDGEIKTVFHSGNLKIRCGTDRIPLREVKQITGEDNLVEMVVLEDMFERGWVSRPETIKLEAGWLAPECFASWDGVRALSGLPVLPRDKKKVYRTDVERALTPEFLETLYDIGHFVKLGEADPMVFEWWHLKFREDSSTEAAIRYWERFKQRLRTLGVPFFLVNPLTGEPIRESGVSAHTWAIKFRKKALDNFIKQHLPELEDDDDDDYDDSNELAVLEALRGTA